jgi:hypothetical protein
MCRLERRMKKVSGWCVQNKENLRELSGGPEAKDRSTLNHVLTTFCHLLTPVSC